MKDKISDSITELFYEKHIYVASPGSALGIKSLE